MAEIAELERLQRALDIRFARPELLSLALTHRSCGQPNNERLEFLGDSILNHVIARYLYDAFPDASEGELHRMRVALVNGDTLAGVARDLGLGDYLRLGPAELKSGTRRRKSIMADTLEAVIGAILLDAGVATVQERVQAWFAGRAKTLNPDTAPKDAKSTLQEYLQGRGLPLPEYSLLRAEGEDHCRQFHVECAVTALSITAQGSGTSLRRAEQAAAAAALESLDV